MLAAAQRRGDTARQDYVPELRCAFISVIASDAAGAAGHNMCYAVGDELWSFTSERSRRLWDEMSTPPVRKISSRLVVTYAGYVGESQLLEELYKRGLQQPQIGNDLYGGAGLLMFWTHEAVAPWQTQAWLDEQRRSLRPNQYLRQIENRWVDSELTFIDMAKWDQWSIPMLDLRPTLTCCAGAMANLIDRRTFQCLFSTKSADTTRPGCWRAGA